jgi:hypothetical protein
MNTYWTSRFNHIAFFSAVVLFAWSVCAPAQVGGTPVSVELPGFGHDVELDTQRNQLYISVPETDEIVVVSLATLSIVDSFFVGQAPHGIDLSDDGATLYAALNASGSVAYLDIDTGDVMTVDVGAELDDPRAWDVIEGKPHRVYVSSNPGSSGFAYIVQIKTDEGNTASRVASGRIIRCAPAFEDSPDDEFLYVGECFSPNSLYKLDLADDTAPILVENAHGSVDGTNHLEVNTSGTRIFLRSGQVLRTSSFLQDGLVTPGPAQISNDGMKVYVATGFDTIVAHDATAYTEIETITLPCIFLNIQTFRVLPMDSGFLVLGDDVLCGIVDAAPVSLYISPPSGQFISTQTADVAVVIGVGDSSISELTITLNGVDRTRLFNRCFIPGRTRAGQLTLRCPGFKLPLGTRELAVSVRLENGTELSDTVTWETARAIE